MTVPDNDRHLITLSAGWSLWRWFVVRGAGFPARMLADLAAPRSTADIDRLLQLDDHVTAARSNATEVLEALLTTVDRDARKPIERALKSLARGKAPDPIGLSDNIRTILEAVSASESALDEQRRATSTILAEEQLRISKALRSAVADPRFHEALLWQNREAVHGSLEWLRRQPVTGTNSQIRRSEATVASYLQRYCAKNDTIGFFGPAAYATLARSDDSASLRPGKSLLARRTVYFEHWGILAIADLLSDDAEVKVQLAPRLTGTVRVVGNRMFPAVGPEVVLSDDVVGVLQLCDGVRSAREIARALVEDPGRDFEDEDDVYSLLESLRDKQLVVWSLEIPFDTASPDEALRELLEPLTGEARDRMVALLDTLASGRSRIAAAAGDVSALDHALADLATTFEHATGRGATRNPGQTYAGRTLLFEDCERDLELTLGPSFVASFSSALSLVLESARWMSFKLADHFRRTLETVFGEVRSRTGTDIVELARVSDRVLAEGFGSDGTDLVSDLQAESDRRWRAILAFSDDDACVQRSSAELLPKVREAFAAPNPGWPGARHHSVDLMVAARSFEDLRCGRAPVILGELHPAGVQVVTALFARGCPWRDDAFKAYRDGVPPHQQVTVPFPKHRANRAVCGPQYLQQFVLDVGMRHSSSSAQTLAPNELVVESTDQGLVIRTRDSRAVFDAVAFFSAWLSDAIRHRFVIVRPARHMPRIVIDNLVVCRETWRMSPQELTFAKCERGIEQLTAARKWQRQHRIPRWCFVKTPEEQKPIFLDFESPISLEILLKLARNASSITISEMLPSLDELWLVDAEGQRYTCELRFTAADPIGQASQPTR